MSTNPKRRRRRPQGPTIAGLAGTTPKLLFEPLHYTVDEVNVHVPAGRVRA